MKKNSKWQIRVESSPRWVPGKFLIRNDDGAVIPERWAEHEKDKNGVVQLTPFYVEYYRIEPESWQEWQGVANLIIAEIVGEVRLANQARAFVGGAKDPEKFAAEIDRKIVELRKEQKAIEGEDS